MEVVDDVMATIALYTNPQVTSSVMLMDHRLAARVYAQSFWRNKCLKETRGLVAKDHLITVDSQVQWYAYYVMRNRTFYGVPVTVSDDGVCNVMYDGPCIAIFGVGFDNFVVQLPDYSIRCFLFRDGREGVLTASPFDLILSSTIVSVSRIDAVCEDTRTRVMLFLLESGDVIVYDYINKSQYTLATDVVEIESQLLLLRSGKVAYFDFEHLENGFLSGKVILRKPYHRPLDSHTNIIKLLDETHEGYDICGLLLAADGFIVMPGDKSNTPIIRYDYYYDSDEDTDEFQSQATFIADGIVSGFKSFPAHAGAQLVAFVYRTKKATVRYVTFDRRLHISKDDVTTTSNFQVQIARGDMSIVILDT